MEETIEYKGHEIEITQDGHASNPFEEWDCEPSLMTISGRHGSTNEFGEDIRADLIERITDNQKIRHQKTFSFIFGIAHEELGEGRDSKLNEIDDLLSDANFDELKQVCNHFKIPCYNGTSQGYSQSEWADVFIYMTKADQERLGTPNKRIQAVLDGAFNLFGYWAWGDVYGFNVESTGDSCCGFYGDDHEKSGLLEMARGEIDHHVEKEKKKRIERIKTFIRNRVPLMYRMSF
ncbi:MAG: hypothetical protein ACI9DM_000229 [Cyclobacteriaceae bacterium]|jgi:hypothetical protein